jgi:hypothetical protein
MMLEQKQEQQFIQAINEVYFGRTPSINNLFNAYCDWREPFLTVSPKVWANPLGNYYNKQHKLFEELTCKQFGFNTFSYLVKGDSAVNSYTYAYGLIPIGASSRDIEITKDGYRFKDTSKFNSIIRVYPAIAFNSDLTNEEAFAVFLHEVGHNFQAAANNTIFCLSAATGIFQIMIDGLKWGPTQVVADLLFTSNAARGVVNVFDNMITRNKFASNLLCCINSMIYALKHCITVFSIWASILLIPVTSLMNIIYTLPAFLVELVTGQHAVGYYGERFADSFAASYGFGEATASLQNKFSNIITGDPTADIIFNDVPILSHALQLAMLPTMLLLGVMDVHPDGASRCASVIKDMRRDLNDPNLDPKLKKQLAKDVDDFEKTMNEYYAEATKVSNPGIVSALLQKALYYSGGSVKMKMSELPYMKIGGFGAQTNKNTNSIIAKAKIK